MTPRHDGTAASPSPSRGGLGWGWGKGSGFGSSAHAPHPPPGLPLEGGGAGNSIAAAATLAALAIAGGALSALAPWWLALGAFAAMAVGLAILASPYFGLMLTLALAAQAIPGAPIPALPLGGALVQPAELALLATLAAAAVHVLLDGRMPAASGERAGGFDLRFAALALFTFAALGLSFAASAYLMGQRDFAFPVLRNFLPLALLPLLPRLLPDRRRVELTERLLIAFGVLIALFIAVQAFADVQLLSGRFEDLGLEQTTGVTRTVLWGPELLIILALLLIGRRGAKFALSHVWPLPAAAILLLGLMGTYTRTFWIATVICVALLTLLTAGARGCLRLAAVIVPATIVVWAAVYAASPRIGEAALDRAFGIGREIESGDSFGWRGKENAMAMESIAKHPLLGIGFDGVYKKTISTRGHFAGEETYIHNAYLYFQLKMGLLGSLVLAAFLLLYLRLMAAAAAIPDARDRTSALCHGVLGVAIMLIGYSGQTVSRFVTLLIICLMFTLMRFYAARH
ncbi:O-antigen ligase family protein [Propionivibrio sp.]|uniref:O-antigen ligase family protein n=1 Tax=Propionivibrio sp. TaxID=2212460 RepID=UPI0039E38C24